MTARLDQAVTVSGWQVRFFSGQTVDRDCRPPLLRQPDSRMTSDVLLPLQVVVPEGEALLAKHGIWAVPCPLLKQSLSISFRPSVSHPETVQGHGCRECSVDRFLAGSMVIIYFVATGRACMEQKIEYQGPLSCFAGIARPSWSGSLRRTLESCTVAIRKELRSGSIKSRRTYGAGRRSRIGEASSCSRSLDWSCWHTASGCQ